MVDRPPRSSEIIRNRPNDRSPATDDRPHWRQGRLMRLDIPFEERRYVRQQEPEFAPPPAPTEVEPTQLRVPASPLTRRIERLQERARENHAHYVAQPRRDRSIEPDHDRADKRRQIEHRPRRTREGVALNIRGLRLRPEEQALLAETGRFRVLAVNDIARRSTAATSKRCRPTSDIWKSGTWSESIPCPREMTDAGFARNASKSSHSRSTASYWPMRPATFRQIRGSTTAL